MHSRIDGPKETMPPLDNLSAHALSIRRRAIRRQIRKLDKRILGLRKQHAIFEACKIVDEAIARSNE